MQMPNWERISLIRHVIHCHDAYWRWAPPKKTIKTSAEALTFLEMTWGRCFCSMMGFQHWHLAIPPLWLYLPSFWAFYVLQGCTYSWVSAKSFFQGSSSHWIQNGKNLRDYPFVSRLDVIYANASHPLFLPNTKLSCLPRPLHSTYQYSLYFRPRDATFHPTTRQAERTHHLWRDRSCGSDVPFLSVRWEPPDTESSDGDTRNTDGSVSLPVTGAGPPATRGSPDFFRVRILRL